MNTWSDDLDRSAAMLVIEAAAGAWGLNTKGPEDPTTPQSPPALLGPSTSAEAMFSAIMARISGVLGVWVRPVNYAQRLLSPFKSTLFNKSKKPQQLLKKNLTWKFFKRLPQSK